MVDATKVESPVRPPCDMSRTDTATNRHFVYIRRKLESDIVKNNAFCSTSLKAGSQAKTQIEKQNFSCLKELIPLPRPLMSPSDRLDWEERYQRLQMLLKKIDESDQADYTQTLGSFSPVELSRHAVELEKRSIQLSLDEAKEVQCVAELNVLGRPLNSFISFSTY